MRSAETVERAGRARGRCNDAVIDVRADPVLVLLETARGLVGADPRTALEAICQAAALLRARGSAPTHCSQLTRAEERVVTLAASGVSNRDIATTLFLSPRTVESHLSHSYAKLGVRSKAELAAWWAVEGAPY